MPGAADGLSPSTVHGLQSQGGLWECALPVPLCVLSPQSLINPCCLFLEGHPASLLEGQRSLWGITKWFGFFSLFPSHQDGSLGFL